MADLTAQERGSLEQWLARLLHGLDVGRKKAIRQRKAERADKDRHLRNFWASRKAAGWRDDEILHAYAEQRGVKRDTARRRARRLELVSP